RGGGEGGGGGGKVGEGGFPVVRMPLRQWMLRITAYADRLLADLDLVDWSESIKKLQCDWIGRSEGAEVDFPLSPVANAPGSPSARSASEEFPPIRVFTTRPDTLFGATYMVLAPEHALVEKITTSAQRQAVKSYQAEAARKSERERTEGSKKKTGVFTGAYAINPVNEEEIPIWIADYVLATYGTGAIMAVPAHDLRDWEFARTFGLPIREVVQPPRGYKPSKEESALAYEEGGKTHYPFAGEGTAINSGKFTGLPTAEVQRGTSAGRRERGWGRGRLNTRRGAGLSSGRGAGGGPFPILHEVDEKGTPTGVVEPLPPEELPLRLPELEDYRPSGRPEPPLGKAT